MNSDTETGTLLEQAYEVMEDGRVAGDYHERHGVNSAQILTVYDDETASLVANHLAPRIEGKVVIEIGGGIGLLAFHLSLFAERIYCIEAEPVWAWTYVRCLYDRKPSNVSYLFGAAQQFEGMLRGNVALFCTHSDAVGMRELAGRFAPEVIDVYGEITKGDPLAPYRDMTRS